MYHKICKQASRIEKQMHPEASPLDQTIIENISQIDFDILCQINFPRLCYQLVRGKKERNFHKNEEKN